MAIIAPPVCKAYSTSFEQFSHKFANSALLCSIFNRAEGNKLLIRCHGQPPLHGIASHRRRWPRCASCAESIAFFAKATPEAEVRSWRAVRRTRLHPDVSGDCTPILLSVEQQSSMQVRSMAWTGSQGRAVCTAGSDKLKPRDRKRSTW